MLYVNGIPLINIELKNPASFSESWHDAYIQIKDYEKTIPELYKYVQIGVAAEQIARYFAIAPWLKDVGAYEWKEGSKDPIDSVIWMLSWNRILDFIRNYLFFREEAGLETKVIARYMQYRASEKIVNRVLGHLQGTEDKDRGLIWHWQGSGKTLTMIFAANKLYHLKKLANPSIFFIVDRLDLKCQLYQEFTGLDAVTPEIIDSIGELKKVIKHDEYRGKKGVFITLIHKFRVEELEELRVTLNKLKESGKETIATRNNVIVFIDEAHRTQYGTLAGQMEDILRSGFFFAFTGTPISKKEKDTYGKFAFPPEELYLDRYFITDSIKDGFTLKIVYQPRLEKDVHLDQKMLKAFAELEFDELPETIGEKVEIEVKKKLNTINLFLENKERIKLVAVDVAKYFKENVHGKFKAMLVAPSRYACIHYKRALDQHLPPEYSEVVMTYNSGDDQIIRDYRDELKEKYHGKDIDDIKKEVLEKFKDEKDHPQILIVTEMLLTGFDAPVLQTMYLDKPLKEHRLLQAVARTNRPFKDLKEAGYIIDYIGIIKEELKRAFEIYSKEEINGALYDLEAIRSEFKHLMNDTLDIFEDVTRDRYDRETLLQTIEILTSDEETGEKFLENYRKLRRLFEFLGSDISKLERLADYKWLSAIYVYYVKIVSRDTVLDDLVKKYYDKTIKFIHKTTDFEQFEKDLPVIEFDENYLENLEREIDNTREKAANIVFTLNKFVLVNIHQNPVYESVADKVGRVLKSWKEKTKNFEEIYLQGTEIIQEIKESTERQRKLGFSDMEYALLLDLEKGFGRKEEILEDVKELSELIKKTFLRAGQNRGWHVNRLREKYAYL
jgi:type I restriction enzyme R subunit